MDDYDQEYLKEFLNFYMEVLDYAEVLWEDNIKHDVLLECTLSRYPYKDSWQSVDVLRVYVKTLRENKK